jgi:hypothetical protein
MNLAVPANRNAVHNVQSPVAAELQICISAASLSRKPLGGHLLTTAILLRVRESALNCRLCLT